MSRPRPRSRSARPVDAPGQTARQAALLQLDSVLGQGQMLSDAHGAGTGAERAEARGLADLTLRRLGQIDQVLGQFVQRSPKGRGQQILRLMTAELLFAGTAPHAAVDLAVRLAQSNRATMRLSGLVNAVGRRVAEGGPAIVQDQDAATLNMPGWLRERLIKDWGAETARAIAEAHLTGAPHDLSLRRPADLDALARETGGTILPTGSLRLPDRPQISALPGYAQGAWWVQDAAAALPARLVREPAGKRILDLCAAPGGKTQQLAAAGADVTALDLSEARLERLHENLARTGLSAEIIVADALEWQPQASFDVVLLDAPCSATGTVRRHPDLPHRSSGKAIKGLVDLQARLLQRAADWVAPGGTLIYCTCSLLKSEGEARAESFLSKSPGFARDPVTDAEMPPEFVTAAGDVRTRPDHWHDLGGLDGFFACRLRRNP